MPNVFIKEAVNLRTVLLLVKIMRNKKLSLMIVPQLAAMQSFPVNVKGKTILKRIRMSRISHHLA